MPLPRTILADDHRIIVDGLRSLLRDTIDIVATTADGASLLESIRRLKPDLVIADISMPELSGLDVLRRLRAMQNAVPRFIILTMHADAQLAADALRLGASGYLLKESAGEELITAIGEVMRGRTYLSPAVTEGVVSTLAATGTAWRHPALTARQREVLQLIAAGKRMKEIGTELRLSRRTVEMHKYAMMRALGTRTTAELVKYYMKHQDVLTKDVG